MQNCLLIAARKENQQLNNTIIMKLIHLEAILCFLYKTCRKNISLIMTGTNGNSSTNLEHKYTVKNNMPQTSELKYFTPIKHLT